MQKTCDSLDNHSKTGNFSAESKSNLCFDQYARVGKMRILIRINIHILHVVTSADPQISTSALYRRPMLDTITSIQHRMLTCGNGRQRASPHVDGRRWAVTDVDLSF